MDSVAAASRPVIGRDFFDRARARLRLEVPPALHDHAAPATRGDLDLDPALWARAGVAASTLAAVIAMRAPARRALIACMCVLLPR